MALFMLDTNMCIYLMKNQPEQVAIAAHAASLNVTLVTNNERDFAAYPGLQIENWLNG